MLILVTGLPGSGKANFSMELAAELVDCSWLNGRVIRGMIGDASLSPSALRQEAMRMREMATWCRTEHVICSFSCATERLRWTLAPEFTIFLDTVESSDCVELDRMFERPAKADVILETVDPAAVLYIADQIRLRC